MTITCVAGMHRSGTSMVARLLNLAGLSLGDEGELLRAATDNPEGFWENEEFVAINDAILTYYKGGWDVPPQMHERWETSKEVNQFSERATKLIGKFANEKDWGWKDPRNSLTYPFWSQLLPELKVVICLRNPAEVAESLTKRGFNSLSFGVNLWYEYNKRLIETIPIDSYIITHYDTYFINPQNELRRLVEFLNLKASDEQILNACASIQAPIRHNKSSLQDLVQKNVSPEIIDTYVQLCAKAGDVYWDQASYLFKNAKANNMKDSERSEANKDSLHLLEQAHLISDLKLTIATLEAEHSQAIATLEAEHSQAIATLEAEINVWNNRWADLEENNIAWKMLKKTQKLVMILAPYGSKRYASIQMLKRVMVIWKEDGVTAVWTKLKQKTLAQKHSQTSPKLQVEDRVQVSIVIPVYNALSMTKECLSSIYRETQNPYFEIIVVDNASKDGTERWLRKKQREHDNLRVFRMEKNIGFGPAVNVGMQRSQGEFVVILNNDTVVAPRWLEHLLAAMAKDQSIGIVSPMTNYVGEGPQIDQRAQNFPPDVDVVQKYAKTIAERDEIRYEANRLVFFCVMIRREVVDLVGGLDEGYEKGNFEDDDYCLRTRMLGYKLAIAKNSFVYHHGTVTFKKNKISHTQWMETNRRRFYRKAGRIAITLSPQSRSASSARGKMLSVIVRTKDRPFLLQRALTSLANQTRKDFEIVLVNDGGEDVASLLPLFTPFFHINYIYHRVSNGRTAAINSGLEHAQGKWIAYLDDDDVVYPWHFESLLEKAEDSEGMVFYGDYNRALLADARGVDPLDIIGVHPWEYKRQELLAQNYLPIHSYIHLRKCVNDVGNWDETLDRLEDYEFLIRLSGICDFQHVPKVTCEYRFYLDGGSSISKGRREYLDALEYIYQKYPNDNEKVNYERQHTLDMLRLQTEKIESLLKEFGDEGEEKAIQREIIRITTGM